MNLEDFVFDKFYAHFIKCEGFLLRSKVALLLYTYCEHIFTRDNDLFFTYINTIKRMITGDPS
jgi:hypothetical protein